MSRTTAGGGVTAGNALLLSWCPGGRLGAVGRNVSSPGAEKWRGLDESGAPGFPRCWGFQLGQQTETEHQLAAGTGDRQRRGRQTVKSLS